MLLDTLAKARRELPRGHLHPAGEAGQVHVIEASSDLVNWQEIGVVTHAANGSFEFEYREAGALSHRYYRIVVR